MIEDDNSITGGSIAQKFEGGIMNPKRKLDIELGGMLSKDGSMRLPQILQNLDYSGFDDNLKGKERGGNIAFDPFFLPTDQDPKCKEWSSTNGDGTIEDDRTEDSQPSSTFH